MRHGPFPGPLRQLQGEHRDAAGRQAMRALRHQGGGLARVHLHIVDHDIARRGRTKIRLRRGAYMRHARVAGHARIQSGRIHRDDRQPAAAQHARPAARSRAQVQRGPGRRQAHVKGLQGLQQFEFRAADLVFLPQKAPASARPGAVVFPDRGNAQPARVRAEHHGKNLARLPDVQRRARLQRERAQALVDVKARVGRAGVAHQARLHRKGHAGPQRGQKRPARGFQRLQVFLSARQPHGGLRGAGVAQEHRRRRQAVAYAKRDARLQEPNDARALRFRQRQRQCAGLRGDDAIHGSPPLP